MLTDRNILIDRRDSTIVLTLAPTASPIEIHLDLQQCRELAYTLLELSLRD